MGEIKIYPDCRMYKFQAAHFKGYIRLSTFFLLVNCFYVEKVILVRRIVLNTLN